VTLLEPLVALVILGLAAVGFLESFQATSRATRDAEEWIQAVSYAEASMEQTKLGAGADDRTFPISLPPGFAHDVGVEPMPGIHGVETVTVRIMLPRGGAFVLHRVVRAP
jgi:hypothetical protein